jgi:hypothetical protein
LNVCGLCGPNASLDLLEPKFQPSTMKYGIGLFLLAQWGISASLAFVPTASSWSSLRPASLSTLSATPAGSDKVPCFGAAPFFGDRTVFFGENYWNKLTSEWGTEDTGKYLRAAYVMLCV